MEEISKELQLINQRLANLELQAQDSDRKLEAFKREFREKKSENVGLTDKRFQDCSLASSSFEIKRSDVALDDLNTAEVSGKSNASRDFTKG